MSFYLVVSSEDEDGNPVDTLQEALTVHSPTFTLTDATKDDYTYPVSGWWWFDTEAEARAALLSEGSLAAALSMLLNVLADAQTLEEARDAAQLAREMLT